MGLSRRAFLKIAAGSGGVAATVGTGAKAFHKLISYVEPPPATLPGVFTPYATVCRECPAGCGMLLQHRDGRVTKAEGSPDHPINHGGLCARGQSSVQGLYDPDRLRQPLAMMPDKIRSTLSWQAAIAAIASHLRESQGRVALLSDLQTGALAEIMHAFVAAFGSDRTLFYEPFNHEPLRAAHGMLFGQPVIPQYRLDQCQFILSLGVDFLETWASPVEYALQFSRIHSYVPDPRRMGQMVYAGPRYSMTATNADTFLQIPPGADRWLALGMLREMLSHGWVRADLGPARQQVEAWARQAPAVPGVSSEQIQELARRFYEAKASVALAGPVGAVGEPTQQAAVAAGLLNWVAGRVGQIADFGASHALSRTATEEQVRQFLGSLRREDTLIVHAANPVYARVDAMEAIKRPGLVVYLGSMLDETAALAHCLLPTDYPLESWGEYEAYDNVHGLMQPTMGRLHDTRSAGDILLALAEAAERPLHPPGAKEPVESFEQWLRHRWTRLQQNMEPGMPFADFWTQALRRGGAWAEPAAGPEIRLQAGLDLPAARATQPSPVLEAEDVTVELWPWAPVLLFDGRLANRGWIQEVPEPMSQFCWSSWVDLHPLTAARVGLGEGEAVNVQTDVGNAIVQIRITTAVAPDVAAFPFGQGHWELGHLAAGIGANVFHLLGRAESPSPFGRASLQKANAAQAAVSLQPTQLQHDRDIVRWEDAAKLRDAHSGPSEPITWPTPAGYVKGRDLYRGHEHRGHRWAMVIDLQRCIGCQACSVACYAENNIAIVGPKQCANGREMAWLKVVPYRERQHQDRVGWLVLPCQHCDAAPCEPVCPVYAAVHNEEGLNAQIYNRCIGTRYCSNNCPYKVRRFNWFDPKFEPPLDLQLNPEVTVRCRGVMEKCTFCVQRIRLAEYQAKRENRPVRDGEVIPACVQTCPTKAFVFGDLMDPQSQVRRIMENDPCRYQLLRELNTKPAVVYLKRIKQNDLVPSQQA